MQVRLPDWHVVAQACRRTDEAGSGSTSAAGSTGCAEMRWDGPHGRFRSTTAMIVAVSNA